jgi:hypothetical protein
MDAPAPIDRCLAILLLRTAGCSQDAVASMIHCAKSLIGRVENWFGTRLAYTKAVEICNHMAIKEVIDVDLLHREEVDKRLLEKLTRITPGTVLRRYREDHLFKVEWWESLDLASRLQASLSFISAKDWAIWGLPDTGQPPLTSEAGLRIWMDRGKLVVKLAVEQDNRFPVFLTRLKAIFPEFKDYDRWRESLVELVSMCWALAHEIWSKAENETGLELSGIPVMGRGHLLNVPRFIYEFALANYDSGKQPGLVVLDHGGHRFRLVPKDQPDYILAVGSMNEMQRCQDVTTSLARRYASDGRIGDINANALQVKKQSAPLQAVLSRLISEATSEN